MRARATVGAGLVVALVGTALVAGAKGGFPATRPRLLSGAAWLASVQVGQLTLLDGSSAEVAGQVSVATPGARLEVVQQGSAAYGVDGSTGSVRRVDGATFRVSTRVVPVPQARDGLRVFAGARALYAVDTARGVLAELDPRTLVARGRPLSLSTGIGDQAATVDSGGRLWLLDTEKGDLSWFAGGRRHDRRGAASPGAGPPAPGRGGPGAGGPGG